MRMLPRLSVNRPITVVMLFIASCVMGLIAWSRMPLELFPSGFTGTSLYLSVPYMDAQPRETEEKITLPVEDRLGDIEGLKQIRSNSRAGNAGFELSFHRSMPMDAAYNAVVDRMERVLPELPEEVQEYFVYKWDASDAPIMWMGVGMEGTPEEQYRLLYKTIMRRVERIPGVGGVSAWGPDPKAIFIGFNRDALMGYRLSTWEIMQRIRAENFQLPSGRLIENGKVRYVRSLSRLEGVEGLKRFPARENLPLESVADIQYRLSASAEISRIDGKDGAGMVIRKEADANTVETSEAIHAALDQLNERTGTDFFVFFDQGELIEEGLDNLKESVLTGALFAVTVLYIFLRSFPLTLLIAACIPFTLVLSVASLHLRGGSLNLLSLMGLMLAVGMVVDNAIVVVESIYARRLEGEEARKAAVEGASEVGLAITLSTLTTIAVFLPVILMNSDTEYAFFLGEIGFPIIAALLASLLAALAFTPLTTTFLKSGAAAMKVPRWITWLTGKYSAVLRWVLAKRADSILAMLLLGALTMALPVQSVGCTDEDENYTDFEINFDLPPQFSYAERLDTVKRIEGMVESNREKWDIEFYFTRLEGNSNSGRCRVFLEDEGKGELTPEEAIKDAMAQLPEIAGTKMHIGWAGSEQDKRQFEVTLRGEDTNTLETLAGQTLETLGRVEGVLSATSGLEDDSRPELQLVVDRDAAARYAVSATTIGWTVASALRSNSLPEQRIDGELVDVVARFRYQDRSDIGRLLDFPVFSQALSRTIPLGKMVEVEAAPSLGTIRRINRRTAYPLKVNIGQGHDPDDIRFAVSHALSQQSFPPGYSFDPPFDPDKLADRSALTLSILMSVVLVFLIMGALFESFLLPMAVITTIPMAAFGAYWVLYAAGAGMDSIGGIGMVILIGVVVNNGIVLIEHVNQLRSRGMERNRALVEGGARRLRPILMTALTTIFGLLPMAMGDESASISYASMGKVVVGGLVAGTLLTLFYVPVLYTVLDDIRVEAGRWARWIAGGKAQETTG
jgi:hydrophobic/amphiphilic exporter-1 (mainly G- bacteria), HAE1 family